MSGRKISEGMMFQSETALFESALVLGLYLYLGPERPERPVAVLWPMDGGRYAKEEYELLDSVDWTEIGVLGLAPALSESEDHPWTTVLSYCPIA